MFLDPPASFFGAASLYMLFVISNICESKNKQALRLLLLYTWFSSTAYKENSRYKRHGFNLNSG